jgi:hypothetical protein
MCNKPIYQDSGPVFGTVTAEKQFFAVSPAYVWSPRVPFGIRISCFGFSLENRWYLRAKIKKARKVLLLPRQELSARRASTIM